MKLLDRSFYERSTLVVALELIGKVLTVRSQVEGSTATAERNECSVIIVETEAYLGSDDPASHASRGVTERNRVMFGPPGHAYVYFIYGSHYCFNVVTESDGVPGAVLIRAGEPCSGELHMMARRRVTELIHATNGPGKLTQALGIRREHSGCLLTEGDIVLGYDERSVSEMMHIHAGPRIGITHARERAYRFYMRNNPYVSVR